MGFWGLQGTRRNQEGRPEIQFRKACPARSDGVSMRTWAQMAQGRSGLRPGNPRQHAPRHRLTDRPLDARLDQETRRDTLEAVSPPLAGGR